MVLSISAVFVRMRGGSFEAVEGEGTLLLLSGRLIASAGITNSSGRLAREFEV